MRQNKRSLLDGSNHLAARCAALALAVAAWTASAQAQVNVKDLETDCEQGVQASPFIPVDNWIYPAVLRLYSLGYIDRVYTGLRPWTRASLRHALEDTQTRLEDEEGGAARDEAEGIYNALLHELREEERGVCQRRRPEARLESAYSVVRGISGTPLRDSFHLGSTFVNDYGRPYAHGANNSTGLSGYATAGRFALYLRGEFQGAQSATGYSSSLYQALAEKDLTVNPSTGVAYAGQSTIPLGPIDAAKQGRFLEVYVSAQVLNHVISFGKQDEWLGAATGAAMAYSNNAENIYALHVNRVEPLEIPLLSRLTGPFRYEFLVGALRGHRLMRNPLSTASNLLQQPNVINPGNPWVHVEQVSFKPTANLEFGFERTAIFGGEGHAPVTLHSFLKSFFSLSAPMDASIKHGRKDPGARFGAFNMTYRLPFVRNWLTFYTDGEVHDDISPIDAPRRAAWRPGLYLSHVPGAQRLDLRVEGVLTDPSISTSQNGQFMYWETVERQGYTNQGQLFGDWIGREDKGGQAWATWHLSGNEWVQASWRRQKAAKDFIPGGTTLNDFDVQVAKRIGREFEVQGAVKMERWRAPVYLAGPQTVTATTVQLIWRPQRKVSF